MNESECGYLLGYISKIIENPEVTHSVNQELQDFKQEIIRFMKEKKK